MLQFVCRFEAMRQTIIRGQELERLRPHKGTSKGSHGNAGVGKARRPSQSPSFPRSRTKCARSTAGTQANLRAKIHKGQHCPSPAFSTSFIVLTLAWVPAVLPLAIRERRGNDVTGCVARELTNLIVLSIDFHVKHDAKTLV